MAPEESDHSDHDDHEGEEMPCFFLDIDPEDAELYCPFCGAAILEEGSAEVTACDHLVAHEISEDETEDIDVDVDGSELVLVLVEDSDPPREHFLVFRPPWE